MLAPVASKVWRAGAVTTGDVVSTTVTFEVAVALFPEASVAVQVTVVVPTGKPATGASFVTTGEASTMSETVGVPKSAITDFTPVAS